MITWMNLEGIILSDISQTEKDKYVWYHLYVESKNKKKFNLIETERGIMVPRDEGVREIGRC